jgi:hypothetical protein
VGNKVCESAERKRERRYVLTSQTADLSIEVKFFTILRRGGQSAGSSKLIKASRWLCILLVSLSFFLTRVELSNGISAWMGESDCCPEDRWEFSVNLLPHGMCYCGSCSKSLFDPSRRVSNGALRLGSHHFCRLSVELSEDWAFNFSTTSSRM